MAPAGLLVWLCVLGSCSPVPNLEPHIAHFEIGELINQANLIVVGVVESDRVVRIFPETKDSIGLELRLARVGVEGVIEGQFRGDRLSFYYYYAPGGWNGPPPNTLTLGERDIFYLVKDGEVWRPPNDAYFSHTRLVSGKHSISLAKSKDQVREAIARLLLVPGEGTDLDAFLASLPRITGTAMGLVENTEVSRILQSLLANPSPEIRGRVCVVLADFPLNEKSCLAEVIRDVHALPEDRKRAQELMH